jgi:RNA polymerase sigma factor (sigma-70 family)
MSINTYCKSLKQPISKADEKKSTPDQLVENNLRFVVKVANEFRGRMPLDDLIQYGNIGLTIASRKFKPNRNVRFISYAKYYIQEYIRKGLRKNCLMAHDRFHTSKFVYMDILEPDSGGILENDDAMNYNEKMYKYNPVTLINFMEDGRMVEKCLKKLPEKLAMVIRYKYGIGGCQKTTLKVIGKMIKKSIVNVHTMEKNALKMMKKMLEE